MREWTFPLIRELDVYATGDGTVVKVGWETGYGNTIEIDHGFGYLTRYAHLQGFNTKVGKKVGAWRGDWKSG